EKTASHNATNPMIPAPMTAAHAGSFQWTCPMNTDTASARVAGEVTPWVKTGSYKAAARMPTTAALTPSSARRAIREWRSRSQNGRAPQTRSAAGRNIATKAIAAPTRPVGPEDVEAPRKAANVNNGPGTA